MVCVRPGQNIFIAGDVEVCTDRQRDTTLSIVMRKGVSDASEAKQLQIVAFDLLAVNSAHMTTYLETFGQFQWLLRVRGC